MITITKKAAEEIKLSTHNPDTQGLLIRFAVEETTEGFQYLMGFDELKSDDIHLESNGIEYLVSYNQKDFLTNMVVDFDQIESGQEYSFVFINPNDPNYIPPEGKDYPVKNC
jgi:Fe-S cluster assembly iron-binding protein IscA